MTGTIPTRRGRTHNLRTVVAFEVTRTLKRRSFWLLTLSIPVLFIAISALVTMSSTTAMNNASAGAAKVTPFTYADASGLIDADVAAKAGGAPAADADAARQAVVDGRADLFIAYPADPAKQPIQVIGRDQGMAQPTGYVTTARTVLRDSAKTKVPDARVAAVLTSTAPVTETTYANGKVAPGLAAAILPGAFIALFYLTIIMLGSQMLNITVEEKENRVTEMILTTIHPTTLIVGKLVAVVAIGIVQAVVLVGPLLLLPVALMQGQASGPAVPADDVDGLALDLSQLAPVVNVPAVLLAAALFLGAFLMFTGLLVSIGAVMPTAKDAGSAFGVVVLGLFLPLYTVGILLSEPHGVASEVLTFFPLTAPVSAMLRNATGTLLPWEAAVAVASIYVSAGLLLSLGIRLFRTGSISYDVRLDVRKALGLRRPV